MSKPLRPHSNEKQVVDGIREEIEKARGTHIWDDYVNALRLISQVVFTRSSGFLLELIQNAEDSGLEMPDSGRFTILINKERVKITHNGRAFDENDVRAISGIRSSKKPERGFLGYLGIGFKSVLKITDRPEIYSNGFRFKFDRTHWADPSTTPWHVIPIWIDNPSEAIEENLTTFIIPFRESLEAQRITEEIENIRLELYLFLRWLKRIDVADESAGKHWTLENCGEDEEGITILKRDDEVQRFKFFRRNVSVPQDVKEDRLTQEYRANVTQREIAIGFALDEEGNLAPDEAGAMYGGVYSFLPLGEAKSGAKFPIQADFLVQPGRDALNYEAKWNHWILDEIKNLAVEAIEFFKVHPTWRYQYLPAFEFGHSEGLESFEKLFYPRLIQPIEEYLRDRDSILTINDRWAKMSEVVRLTEDDDAIDDLLRLELFSTREEIAVAFSHGQNIRMAHPNVIEQKANTLRKTDRRDLLANANFLEIKSREPSAGRWFGRLYQWLNEHPQYEKYWPARARYARQRVKGYHDSEIVLTADNSLKKGGEVFLPEQSNNAVLKELSEILQSSKPIINPDVIANLDSEGLANLRGFLTGFTGVQLLNAKAICEQMVLRQIISSAPKPSPEILLTYTRLCKEILGANLGEAADLWIRTKDGTIKTSREVLLPIEFRPAEDWETKREFVPGLHFVDDTYLQDDSSDDGLRSWREFFKSAGVKRSPDNGVELFAINFAIAKLEGWCQNIQPVEKLNYGFDLQAESSEGTTIQIEVKGQSSDHDVELSDNETNTADKYQDSFYLCVVSSIPNSPSAYLVKNPARVGKKHKLTIPVDTWKATIRL